MEAAGELLVKGPRRPPLRYQVPSISSPIDANLRLLEMIGDCTGGKKSELALKPQPMLAQNFSHRALERIHSAEAAGRLFTVIPSLEQRRVVFIDSDEIDEGSRYRSR